MIKFIISFFNSITQQNKAQNRINILIGINKTTKTVKVNLPENYIPMIDLIAMYGISSSAQLERIIEKSNHGRK